MKTGDLRRERQRQRRQGYRETIVHAAERVILRKGYSATTMDDVAREAQFSKATLYKYVPGKGALLSEIMGHYFEEVGRALSEILAGTGSAVDKLRSSLRMILQYSEDKRNITRMLWMDDSTLKFMRVFAASSGKAGPASAADRKLLARLRQKRREVMAIGAKILDEGVATGEFRPLDTLAALSFIEAVLQGYEHNRFWLGDPPVSPNAADGLAFFILEGIRNPDRRMEES